MATIPGTYVQTGLSATTRINAIVDVMLAPQIVEYRQLAIYHERGTRVTPTTFKFTYQNWNPDFPIQLFLNNNPTQMTSGFTRNDTMGTIVVAAATAPDSVLCTYNFDYFPIYMLEGFIVRAVDVINVAPIGATTFYDINSAPTNWDGVICDLTIAMCMEKLILDYDIWKGKLIFSISAQGLNDGSDNIIAQLETIKRNAEERAFRAFDNPQFKAPHYLSKPTQYYYQSLMTGGRMTQHGSNPRLQGWRCNKYLGRVL